MHPSLTTAVAAAQREELLASAAASRRARQARRDRRARRARRASLPIALGSGQVSVPQPRAAANPAPCLQTAGHRPAH